MEALVFLNIIIKETSFSLLYDIYYFIKTSLGDGKLDQ